MQFYTVVLMCRHQSELLLGGSSLKLIGRLLVQSLKRTIIAHKKISASSPPALLLLITENTIIIIYTDIILIVEKEILVRSWRFLVHEKFRLR